MNFARSWLVKYFALRPLITLIALQCRCAVNYKAVYKSGHKRGDAFKLANRQGSLCLSLPAAGESGMSEAIMSASPCVFTYELISNYYIPVYPGISRLEADHKASF